MELAFMLSIVVMLSWGVSDIFAANSSRRIGVTSTFFYSQLALVLLYLFMAALFFPFPSISFRDALLIGIAGVLSMIGYLSLCRGLQIGPVSIVSTTSGAAPLITIPIVLLFLGEFLTPIKGLGATCAIVGALLASFSFKDLRKFSFSKIAKGARYGFLAMVSFGFFYVIMDALIGTSGWFYPLFLAKCVSFLLFAIFPSTLRKVRLKSKGNVSVIGIVALVGVLEFIGHFLYAKSIGIEQTAVVAPISFAYPVVTIALAHWVFKERLEKTQYIGIILAIIGVILLTI